MKKACWAGRLAAAISFSVMLLGCESTQTVNTVLSQSHDNSTKPNVIFILVDDMGYGDAGYLGSEIATPTLDQMAAEGMVLDRNYVYPVCSPTRAALLTGRNPLHLGIPGPIDDHASLPDIKTLPQYFKDLGYSTHMVGKWHLGLSARSSWPQAHGFDSYYGFLGGWVDFYTHVFAGAHDWQRDGEVVREEGHATDLLTDEAISVIENRNAEQPFLLYLAYNAPHTPLQHPPEYSGLNDYPEVSARSVYAEMMTHNDLAIGAVFETLEEQGIVENTIVVFSSDNGGAQGADNGDLNGRKNTPYEGGMRVPGLISWAGQIESGSVLEQPIAIHDWLPTLLAAVGGDPSVVEDAYGQNMWPAISEGAQIEPNIDIMGSANGLSVYDWPWKLVTTESEENGPKNELFNILVDPNESTDLVAEHPKLVERLLAEIKAMPEPDENRLERAFNGIGRYYERGVPQWEQSHEETKVPWVEAATD